MCKNSMPPLWGSVFVFIFTQHFRAGLNNSAPLGLGFQLGQQQAYPYASALISTAEGGCATRASS